MKEIFLSKLIYWSALLFSSMKLSVEINVSTDMVFECDYKEIFLLTR